MRRQPAGRATTIAVAVVLLILFGATLISRSSAAHAQLAGSFQWDRLAAQSQALRQYFPGQKIDGAEAVVVELRLAAQFRNTPSGNCALYVSVSHPAGWKLGKALSDARFAEATAVAITQKLRIPETASTPEGSLARVRQDWRFALTSRELVLRTLWSVPAGSATGRVSALGAVICTYNVVMSWTRLADAGPLGS